MATTPVDDDFDMPEMTDEIMAEFHAPLPEVVAPLIVLVAKDLHMGATQVKPVSKPKAESVDLVGIIANAAVGAGYLSAVWLFVQVWAWVLSS